MSCPSEGVNRSHNATDIPLHQLISNKKKKFNKSYKGVTVEKIHEIIDEMSTFPFGEFLLQRGGANGYWTDRIVYYPLYENINIKESKLNIEYFLTYKSPHVLAQRRLHNIIIDECNKVLKDDIFIGSIPCGMMRDMLNLNKNNKYNLIGIDIDNDVFKYSKELSNKLDINVMYHNKDAWNLNMNNYFDIITSVGLTSYVDDDEQRINLYKEFKNALKKDGLLMTGVLTYPPYYNKTDNKSDNNTDTYSETLYDSNNMTDYQMEDVIFTVAECVWRNFKHSDELKHNFIQAGFSKVEVISNTDFPLVIAQK
eukprot:GHVL01015982.1.p1 GENE.GHVL01015982.1~~GHVL01015982.1.p1  ORF type:complete len:311 (+),score=94.45 GHVL01015982.1:81-1013(+)